ncbi:MAG TPA: hypothetical protein VHS33_10760 [Sphingomicrobium sp.]|nr:hypothetical protein [Sphingomicrobium sp.]
MPDTFAPRAVAGPEQAPITDTTENPSPIESVAPDWGRAKSRWLTLVLLAICAGALAGAIRIHLGADLLHPDSPSYYVFDPSRPVGYPAFLWLVQSLSGNVSWAAPAQTILVAIALFLLGLAIYRATRLPSLALAAQVALVSSVGIWNFSAVIMTEAVATSAVALWCAALIRNLFKPRIFAIFELIVFAAIATTIRPALGALFAGTAVLALFLPQRREKLIALLMVFAGCGAAWEASPVAQWTVHGSMHAASPFARGILQHSLFCPLGTAPTTSEGRFVESYAAPVRNYVDQAPPGALSKVRIEYSTRLRFGLIIPTLSRVHGLSWGWQTDPLLLQIAKERIRSNPLCFAGSVLNSYLRLATFGTGETPRDIAEIRTFFATHPQVQIPNLPTPPGEQKEVRQLASALHQPLPEGGLAGHTAKLPEHNSLPVIVLMEIIYGFASMFGIAALGACVFARRLPNRLAPIVLAVAALGAAYHGAMAITAVVEFGLSRYLVPLWPIAVSIWALTAFGAWQWGSFETAVLRR